jgi:hypothetical protein
MDTPNLLSPPTVPNPIELQARQLEKQFVAALRTWYNGEIQAGLIALELKTSRLYQYYANDWGTYCEGVLGAPRQKIDRLIDLAITKQEYQAELQAAGRLEGTKNTVAGLLPMLADNKILKSIANKAPAIERPEMIRRIVARGDNPTESDVKQVAAEIAKENQPLQTEIPPLPPVLDLRRPFEDLLEQLRSIRYTLAQLSAQDAGRWLRQNPEEPNTGLSNRIAEPLTRLGELLRAAAPFKICPRCIGKAQADWTCELCLGAQWLTEQKARSAGVK